MEDITLNKGQNDAYEKIKDFLNDKNDLNTFLLCGRAGTGKSVLLCYLIEYMEKEKFNFRVLTPTNKSLYVLLELIPEHKKKIITLAKNYNWKQEIDENGIKIDKYTLPNHKDDIIFIDEASMIDKYIFKMIEQETNKKFIFFCDKYQLPPVNETESLIYKKKHYDTYELLEVERQKNADCVITDIIEMYRKNVDGFDIDENYRTSSIFTDDEDDFINVAYETFKEDSDTIVITYTNVKSNIYNSKIRRKLFNKEDVEELDKFYLNECVVFNSSIKIFGKTYSSGIKYTITHLKKKTLYINNPSCCCSSRINSFENKINLNTKIEKCLKCKTPTSLNHTREILFYEIGLNNSDKYLYLPLDEDNSKILYGITEKYKKRCIDTKNKALWMKYYNIIDNYKAPLSHSYSITCHKSQGSTYKNVFLDLNNIDFCSDIITKKKMIYVAMSRTRKNLYILKK